MEEEPAVKKRRVVKSPQLAVIIPDQTILKRRSISNQELKLYEEADNNILAAVIAFRKAMKSVKNLTEKVQDELTAVAFQDLSDAHDTIVEARQIVDESKTRFNEIRLDDFVHVDLITLNLLKFLPLKDIFNLRLTSKRMYDIVTRLWQELNVWKIKLNDFEQLPPPDLFFSSDTDLKMILPCSELMPIQKNIIEKCADRITILDGSANLHSHQPLKGIPETTCKKMTRLESLTASQCRYQSRKNFAILLNQNGESLQELWANRFDAKLLTHVDSNLKFNKLTKLDLETYSSGDEDWVRVVSLINNCPNLVDLRLKGLTIKEKTIANHVKIKCLYLFFFYSEDAVLADNVINLIMSMRESLEYLKMKISVGPTSNIFERDWFLPKVKRAYFTTNTSFDVKKHFGDNAQVYLKVVDDVSHYFHGD